MNGRNVSVEKVLSSIEKAAEQGLKIKINMVVQKGINDGEILEMAKFCYDHDYTLRFIEYMDVGNTNSWELSQVFPNREILKILKQHYEIIPVSDMEWGKWQNGTNIKEPIKKSASFHLSQNLSARAVTGCAFLQMVNFILVYLHPKEKIYGICCKRAAMRN